MRVVAFDLETGGLDPKVHQIIQIAAVAVDPTEDWREIDHFEMKIRLQHDSWTPEALTINSYDEKAWTDAVDEEKALKAFNAFLRRFRDVEKMSKRGNSYRVARLMGHNIARFDVPFVVERIGGGYFEADPYDVLDTIHLARWTYHTKQRAKGDMSLEGLCQERGIELTDAHDALADVRATVALAKSLRK